MQNEEVYCQVVILNFTSELVEHIYTTRLFENQIVANVSTVVDDGRKYNFEGV